MPRLIFNRRGYLATPSAAFRAFSDSRWISHYAWDLAGWPEYAEASAPLYLESGPLRVREEVLLARSLRDLIKSHSLEEWAESFVRLGEDGDRSLAILAATMVERGLQSAIIQRMVKLTNTEYDQLFDGAGPLSSFSSKIKIAHSIGVISKFAKIDLDLIREIRNIFAHSIVHIDFNEPAVLDRCRDLWLGEFLQERFESETDLGSILSVPRDKFQYTTRIYSSVLLAYGSEDDNLPSPDKPAVYRPLAAQISHQNQTHLSPPRSFRG